MKLKLSHDMLLQLNYRIYEILGAKAADSFIHNSNEYGRLFHGLASGHIAVFITSVPCSLHFLQEKKVK